jgi:hypothetical protein
MAFVVAKYWGVLPHVVWAYPFRYYKELRDHVIDSMRPRTESESGESFDWEDDSLTGPMV